MPWTSADTEYLSVAAHEFQHVIAGNNHKNLDTWMNEGFSDLAIYLNGYDVSRHPAAFLAAPNTQLNAWDELERSVPHYGASFLFLTYFYNRFGTDGTKTLIADQSNGLTALDNTLAKLKPGMTVEDLFADWQIANYLNDPKIGDGQFAYKDLKFNKPRVERTIDQFPFTLDGTVNHWASQYFILKGQRDVTVNFDRRDESAPHRRGPARRQDDVVLGARRRQRFYAHARVRPDGATRRHTHILDVVRH